MAFREASTGRAAAVDSPAMSLNSATSVIPISPEIKSRAIEGWFRELRGARGRWRRQSRASHDWQEATLWYEVRERISAFIVKHGSSQDRPPATETELVVMALLMAKDGQTVEDIINWIADSFGYYKQLARTALSRFKAPDQKLIRDFHHRILSSFSRFEVRIHVSPSWSENPQQASISVEQGNRFLNNVLATLEPRHIGARLFPFFKLPPELRHQIYELIFLYPQTGICPDFQDDNDAGCQPGSLKLPVGFYGDPVDFKQWSRSYCSQEKWQSLGRSAFLRTAPIKDILAPLLLSKQFHHEALPVFYAVNHFHFPNLDLLVTAITALRSYAPQHLQYIRHVSVAFSFGKFFRIGATDQFRCLKNFTHLKKLEFVLDEEKYRHRLLSVCRDDPQPKHFTGLTMLKRVAKADKIIFHDCPTLERMFKMESATRAKAKRVGADIGTSGEKHGMIGNGAA